MSSQVQELERPDAVETRHWGRRAFVVAWFGALGVLGAGAALRWRAIVDELTRTPTTAAPQHEPVSRSGSAR